MGRPRKQEIELTGTERASLSDLVRSRSAGPGAPSAHRAGLGGGRLKYRDRAARSGSRSRRSGTGASSLLEQGLAGLYGEQRPGRPRDHDDEAVARLLATVLQSRPSVGTHWTLRGAAATGISKSTVQRRGPSAPRQDLQALDRPAVRREGPGHRGALPQPARSCGHAVVDRKATQPVLPMGFGYVDGITHDYKRHGTTTLFAALDVANGQVLAQCKARQGVPGVPQTRANAAVPSWARRPPHRRQLRHPQAPEGPRLARPAGALPCPLHADLRVVAEPGRALVRDPDQPRNPPWLLRQRQGSGGPDHRLRRRSPGPPPPTTSSPSSRDFVTLFLGHHTRSRPNNTRIRMISRIKPSPPVG